MFKTRKKNRFLKTVSKVKTILIVLIVASLKEILATKTAILFVFGFFFHR